MPLEYEELASKEAKRLFRKACSFHEILDSQALRRTTASVASPNRLPK